MPTEPPPPPTGIGPYGSPPPPPGGPYGGPPFGGPGGPGAPGGSPRAAEVPRASRPTGPGWLAVAVIAALIGAAVGAAGYGIADRVNGSKTAVVRSSAQPGSNTKLAGTPLDIQGVLAKVQPAVVSIGVSGSEGQGAGSGMILTADGEVLTNAHVISGATTIKVTLNGESQGRAADLVGSDAQNDLALVKIRGASGLPTVELGSSEATRVGDQVIAIGNALALPGGPSVTEGIISAKDRTIDTYDNLIQTDAPINEGNSGGPLVNASGQVIGINTLVIRGTGNTRGVAEGLGFAIAVDTAKPIIDQLRKGGPKEGGAFLGVSSQTLTTDIKDSVDTGASDGAIIADVVQGSAAAVAGLQRYDVIVEIDGQPVKTSSDVSRIIRAKNPGDKVTITYYRGQDKRTAQATLGTRPAGG
ncbi:MAG TPA: trypsin-like peptidase domain-containing protein [Acidimicrobiales bacterium]|nr:trypsin-like peptidase domain-containing protein [Acidimicrobiales bacterium]